MSERDDDWTGNDATRSDDPATTGGEPGHDDAGGRAGDHDPAATGASEAPAGDDDRSMRTYLLWGGLVVLGVLSVVATVGLYTSLSSIINVWIGDRYRPIARAVLNFGVLCVAGAGIAVILRRL